MDYGERKGQAGEIYDEDDPEHSRWIHRDKLARIESEELQAAGIILPRTRTSSRSRPRDSSRDKQGNGSRSEHGGQKRQKIEVLPADQGSEEVMNWDLRTPEEAAEDRTAYQDMSGGVKGVSKIPLLKTSPLPIPMEHLERDTPMRRKLNPLWNSDEEPISYSKSRGRSQSNNAFEDTYSTPQTPTHMSAKRLVSDNSPTKKAASQKSSIPKTRAASAPQRPKTRNGSANTSPNNVRRPEGDPPWLASMYKPDPRLPPDQQLLPTVAKRLQQEQWEKEGKFGNAYDTSFRPLNNEEFHQPETPPQTIEMEEQKPENPSTNWPLTSTKSPTLNTGRPGTAGAGGGSYSTVPKIASTAQGAGPPAAMRTPEAPEDAKKKGGCGCCVIM